MLIRPIEVAEIIKYLSYDQVRRYLNGMPYSDVHGARGKHRLYEDVHVDAVKFAHEFRTKLGLRHNDASALGFKMAKNTTEHKDKTWTTINGIVIGVPNGKA